MRKIVFNIFFSVALLFLVYTAFMYAKCFGAAERLPSVVGYSVVRLMIYGASFAEGDDTVSAHITILDTAGRECVTVERSWNGASLSIDFVSAEIAGKKFIFPFRIFGKETVSTYARLSRKSRTTKLPSYYIENGECILFGNNTTQADRKNLFTLASFTFNPLSQAIVGFSKKYTVDLSQCQPGTYYSIVTGTDGSLSIVRE